MVKDEKSGGKKHTYTIDEKGGYKNPQPPILDLQCPSAQVPKCSRLKCLNLDDDGDRDGDGDEEGQRLRGGGK